MSSVAKSAGQSAGARCAYIARLGEYRRGPGGRDRDAVLHLESANMPGWAREAAGADAEAASTAGREYWRAGDIYERANGRVAAQLEFALPIELGLDAWRDLARALAQDATTLSDGGRLPATWAIHAGHGTNPHVHLIISERVNDGIERGPAAWFRRAATGAKAPADGGARKTRDLQRPEWVVAKRARWAELVNAALGAAGSSERIDHRSNLERGIEDLPTEHVGYGAGRQGRNLSNRNRRHLNDEIKNVRAERARLLAESTTGQATGLAQPHLNDDDRPESDHERVAGLPGRESEHPADASAHGTEPRSAHVPGAPGDGHADAAGTRAGGDQPRSAEAAQVAPPAGGDRLLHMPISDVDHGRDGSPGVLPHDEADQLVGGHLGRLDGMRRPGGSDRLPGGTPVTPNAQQPGQRMPAWRGADRLRQWRDAENWPAQAAAKSTTSFSKVFGAARGDPLVLAAREWAKHGAEMSARMDRLLARLEAAQAARAAQSSSQVDAAPARAQTLANAPRLATLRRPARFTATSLRALHRLSDRDLREQLEIAEKGAAASGSALFAALTAKTSPRKRAAINAARAQNAARNARVESLRTEINERAQRARAVPAPVPAEAPVPVAEAAVPPAPARPTTIEDLPPEALDAQLKRARSGAEKAGQEIRLRGALARSLEARDETRKSLDSAGWLSRRAAQLAHDKAAGAVQAAVNAVKRAGLRVSTRADNNARIAAAVQLRDRLRTSEQQITTEHARRVAAAAAPAAVPAERPAPVEVALLQAVVEQRQQTRAAALAATGDRDLARQVLAASHKVDAAARTGLAVEERALLRELREEQERRRRAAWAAAERQRATEPADDEQAVDGRTEGDEDSPRERQQR